MKILIVAFYFLCFPASILCQEKFEAPELAVGSFWKYENEKKAIFTTRVIAIKGDGYLVRTGKNYGIYSRETMNLLFEADKEGNKIEKDPSIYRKLFNYPLFVGKTWEDSLDSMATSRKKAGIKYTKIVSYEVEDYEKVMTPAGPLNAFRVLMKLRGIKLITDTQFIGEAKFWISPEAKWWIKREYYSSKLWENSAANAILIQYHLKK